MKLIVTFFLSSLMTAFLLSFNYNQSPIFNICYKWFGPSAHYIQDQISLLLKNSARETQSFGRKLIENGNPRPNSKTEANLLENENVESEDQKELNNLIREM